MRYELDTQTEICSRIVPQVLHVKGEQTTQIARIEELIQRHMDDTYCEAAKAIDEIPGIAKTSAQQIVAEIGTDMSRFPTENHLCSWNGICPGNNESAGKKTGKTNKGNKLLKSTLIQCAMVAIRNKNSFFYAQYQRLVVRRGKKKAIVAVAHSMLIAIYHVLSGEKFQDLGSQYYNQFNAERKIKSYLEKLEKLGWQSPVPAVTN